MLVKVKHAQFTYREQLGIKTHKRTGEDVPDMAIRHAFLGQTVEITNEEDLERGFDQGAIEEVPEPAEEPEEGSESEEGEPEEAVEEVDLDWTSHDDLVAWIRDDKPPAREVVAAAGDDPEKASKLMEAENEASGGDPRKSVMDPLRKVAGES